MKVYFVNEHTFIDIDRLVAVRIKSGIHNDYVLVFYVDDVEITELYKKIEEAVRALERIYDFIDDRDNIRDSWEWYQKRRVVE